MQNVGRTIQYLDFKFNNKNNIGECSLTQVKQMQKK